MPPDGAVSVALSAVAVVAVSVECSPPSLLRRRLVRGLRRAGAASWWPWSSSFVEPGRSGRGDQMTTVGARRAGPVGPAGRDRGPADARGVVVPTCHGALIGRHVRRHLAAPLRGGVIGSVAGRRRLLGHRTAIVEL